MDARAVKTVLKLFGFKPRLRGYNLAAELIVLILSGDLVPGLISKYAYPKIARLHNTTPNAIERDVRYSITVAWKENRQLFEETFEDSARPTNAEFLFGLADCIAESNGN